MAEKKFLVDLNLGGNKAKNFRLEDYASNSAPTSNFVGRLIYTTNSTDPDRVEVYTGAGWEQVAYLSDVDQDILDIGALTGDGILARQSGTWVMDTSDYVTETGSQTLTNKIYEDPTLKDRISFTDNDDDERMYIEYSGTGATRIVSGDDLSLRSQNGDIILYPGSNDQWGGDGGTGRAYVGWGNDATDGGLGNEIVTRAATQILTNKTINDTLWFTNPSTIPNDGSIVVNDTNENFEITALNGDLVLGATNAVTTKAVVLSGTAGEFLNDPTEPDNQIAVIGDLSNYVTVDGLSWQTITGPKLFTGGLQSKGGMTIWSNNYTTTPSANGYGSIGIDDTTEDVTITASQGMASALGGDVTISAENINLNVPNGGDFVFKEAGTEYLNITKAYTGTTRITTTDDLAIRSTDGDILLYPGNLSGGIGKVYYGWGNADPDTASGIANPENEIITVGYVTGASNTLSANQFLANTIDTIAESFGGYSFAGDAGTDTGMFSTGDGLVGFYSNATEVAHFNDSTFTVDQDLVVTGDLTVNGTLTTLNTETVTVEDNILVLNSNVTGIPLTNAGLEVERGDYTNAAIYWNETSNFWTVDTVKDSTAAAVTHSIARKYVETLTADPAATSFVVTHSLNTRDVIAQVYTTASPYEQVEVAIEYTSVDTITVKLNGATTGDYRVVVTG